MGQLKIEYLSQEEIKMIYNGAMRILAETGVRVHVEEARALLKNAGCEVKDDLLVKIPASAVENALKTVPHNIDIYNRNGELAMQLGETRSYFGPGVTCPSFIDPWTLKVRPSIKQDAADTAKVGDALKHIDFLMSLCMIGDCTPELSDIHEVDAILRNTTKPFVTWSFSAKNVQDIIDMCAAVAGGINNLREKPFMIMYNEPTTPLIHSKTAMEKLILMAKNRLPMVYSPGMILGGTSPVTIAGSLTIGLADALTGVVVSQLVSPGTPIIVSSNGGSMDLNTMQATYGAPDMFLLDGCGTQIFRSLGLPTFGLAGATDAKALDAQAAIEAAVQIVFSAGTGANLVHDFGMSDIGMIGSIPLMVICDEITSMVRYLKRGVIVDEERLAAETIHEVGPGGNFLSEYHTVQFMREDLWFHTLMSRQGYKEWQEAGSKTMQDRAVEKMRDILKNHQVEPLCSDVSGAVDAVVARAEKRIATEGIE